MLGNPLEQDESVWCKTVWKRRNSFNSGCVQHSWLRRDKWKGIMPCHMAVQLRKRKRYVRWSNHRKTILRQSKFKCLKCNFLNSNIVLDSPHSCNLRKCTEGKCIEVKHCDQNHLCYIEAACTSGFPSPVHHGLAKKFGSSKNA